MPLTPDGLTATLTAGLASAGNIGAKVPQLAAGVAAGVMTWNATFKVITVDAGTAGVGTGILPCAIPQPLLLLSLLSGLAATGNVGVRLPLLALGLANGLATGFLQGLITTQHPSVGVGTAVAKFVGASAVAGMISGFASVGMVGPGPTKIATGIGIGIHTAFAAFTIPVPIVGSASPIGASGSGFGVIL